VLEMAEEAPSVVKDKQLCSTTSGYSLPKACCKCNAKLLPTQENPAATCGVKQKRPYGCVVCSNPGCGSQKKGNARNKRSAYCLKAECLSEIAPRCSLEASAVGSWESFFTQNVSQNNRDDVHAMPCFSF
jgi:hypothetical protein